MASSADALVRVVVDVPQRDLVRSVRRPVGGEILIKQQSESEKDHGNVAAGDGAKRCQGAVPAADMGRLRDALARAKQRFGLPAATRVVSCYEAGRDGFWLHRSLASMGIDNVVVDSSSIEVNRRKRRAKLDAGFGRRLDTLKLKGWQRAAASA